MQWKNNPHRLPLLLRGARSVGKTFAIRELGKQFENIIEVNFESDPGLAMSLFQQNLDPHRIVRNLMASFQQKIIPGKTLIFFDEIQRAPLAITALRYFYEKMPDQHIVAAGSLLDFAIEQVGIPVGRVEFLHLYPLSFLEFLVAAGNQFAVTELLTHDPKTSIDLTLHNLLLTKLSEYLAIGGMPKVVDFWLQKNADQCRKIQATITQTYQQDFGEYAKRHQVKYLQELFNKIPLQLGNKFKFSKVGEHRKRELEPCLNLLEMARVISKVSHSAAQGVPLGAQTDINDFKVIFLDVGLAQTILGFDLSSWLASSHDTFVNQGALVEAFVGQEMLAYADPSLRGQLYYWHREVRNSEAEIDYVVQLGRDIVPIEVKSGSGRTLKSLNLFLESHVQSRYGIKFSAANFSVFEKVNNYPLYAIIKPFTMTPILREAVNYLIS